jgi:hypothetical protein
MLTYSLIKHCSICTYDYTGRMCDCERSSYRGWRIWHRLNHMYGSRFGVTANARTVQELHQVIDHHIHDREEWIRGRQA